MKNIAYLTTFLILLVACNGNNEEPDAWGNFESREIMISSEINGKILAILADQGDILAENQLIAITDTILLKLQIGEINASRNSIMTRLGSVDAQNGIIDQQIRNLKVNIERTENMVKDKAATPKQLDDLTGQLAVLERQKDANNTQRANIKSELDVLAARTKMLEEQLERCYIKSPSQGTVLEKYAEAGEITAAGKPLLKIADMSTMELKVYISGSQLAEVKIGQECKVRIDRGEKDYYEYPGEVIHISDKAEFTPKIIQTKEERVHMVYAVKIKVNNDGSLKNGMPAEVLFYLSNQY